jgi:PAS domain S-box-containing protein
MRTIANKSKHREADRVLRESEKKYKDFFDNANDPMFLLDKKGDIVEINNAIEEYGFKKDEMIGKNIVKFVSKNYWINVLKDFTRTIQGKPAKGEVEIITPKGKIIVEYKSNPIKEGSKIVGTQTVLRDITERKKMEKKIIEEKETAQRYVDIAGVIILVIDTQGKVVLINETGCKILGYGRNEIIGKNWIDNFIPEKERNEIKSISDKMLKGEMEVNKYHENYVLTKNGKRLIAWRGIILKDGKGAITGHLSSGEDVTERKQAEEELKKKNFEMEAFQKLTINREEKILELKNKIIELEKKLRDRK